MTAAVELISQLPDRNTGPDEVGRVQEELVSVARSGVPWSLAWWTLADCLAALLRPEPWHGLRTCMFAITSAPPEVEQHLGLLDKSRDWVESILDITHYPHPLPAFDPSWRTSTVLALAKQMYDSRDFAAMPILADALQDAGCDHADILAHCRGDGPHVRGCWVVDLALGKS
jgi:hypothetical protein